jgi:hypothetical protein
MTIDYFNQVKIGSGPTHHGAWARAVDVATQLLNHGRWSGQGVLIIHDAYNAHHKMAGVCGSLDALVEGVDYRIEA